MPGRVIYSHGDDCVHCWLAEMRLVELRDLGVDETIYETMDLRGGRHTAAWLPDNNDDKENPHE